MDKRIVAALAVLLVVSLFTGFALMVRANPAVVPVDLAVTEGLPASARISALRTEMPSRIDTATAIARAKALAGPAVANEAPVVVAERVVYRNTDVVSNARSDALAWMVTFRGVTLYPSVPAGVETTAVAGMNHTEFIDAETGEPIRGIEYRPQR